MTRQGDWFQTFTGKRFYILDPRPEDIDIRDIAHALAMKCRFGGHVAYYYSVAEHCVLLSYLVPSPLAFMALMHDAPETYTGDIMRPVKNSIGDGWRAIESRLDALIAEVFGLSDDADKWALVKEYDERILVDERLVLHRPVLPGKNHGDKLGVAINCLPWQEAERVFLERFEELILRESTRQGEAVIDASSILKRGDKAQLDVKALREGGWPLPAEEEARLRQLAPKLTPERRDA